MQTAQTVMNWLVNNQDDTQVDGYTSWGSPLLGVFLEEIIPEYQGIKIRNGFKFPDGSILALVDFTKGVTSPERFRVILSDDERAKYPFLIRLDDRSRKYLAAVCERIGLIEIRESYYGELTKTLKQRSIPFETVERESFWANASCEVHHYQHPDGRQVWGAEYGYEALEDFHSRLFYFSNDPSMENLKTACNLYLAVNYLEDNPGNVYEYATGKAHHWLDVNAVDDIELPDGLDFFRGR